MGGSPGADAFWGRLEGDPEGSSRRLTETEDVVTTLEQPIFTGYFVEADSAFFIVGLFELAHASDEGTRVCGSSTRRSFMAEPAFGAAGTVALMEVAAWDFTEAGFVDVVAVVLGVGGRGGFRWG